MASRTGYLVFQDNGSAGVGTADGVSAGNFPITFETDDAQTVGTGVVNYPEFGNVSGTFYGVPGQGVYFVPNTNPGLPGTQSGTISSYSESQRSYSDEAGSPSTYNGTAAAESFHAGGGNDTVFGGSGNDTIYGGSGYDQLHGDAGNDVIYGDGSFDDLYGGTGDDTLYSGGSGDTWAYGGDGNDALFASKGAGDSLEGGNDNDTLFGESGADTLVGGSGNDRILGADGNDLIFGGAGQDCIEGGAGNDTIDGGDNSDTIFGGDGNDLISDTGGSLSDDTIYGGAGNDTIAGGVREDLLDGGNDADTFLIANTPGNDTIIGGEGGSDFDTINFSAHSTAVSVTFSNSEQGSVLAGGSTLTFSQIESLLGTTQADYFDGRSADKVNITGGAGNDTILGGNTTTSVGDSIDGGAGNDSIAGYWGADTLFGGDGNDTIDGGDQGDLIYGGAGNDLIDAGEDDVNGDDDLVFGGDGNDTIISTETDSQSNDTLHGDGGDDVISTQGGSAVLFGGTGNDTLTGSYGNDQLFGGTGADRLFGGSGNDTIDGGSGNDTLSGGTGNDRLEGGDGADRFVLQNGEGTDTIIGGEGGVDLDTIDLSAITGGFTINFTGLETGNISFSGSAVTFSQIEAFFLPDGQTFGTGAAGTQLIYLSENADGGGGGGGNDTIFGNGGNDGIGGGSGNDLIYGGAGDDGIGGDAGADTIYGGTGNDGLGGADGNDLIFGDDGNDSIGGDAGSDTIFGGAGNDVMGGGSSNDSIEGGSGNDQLFGDGEDDTLSGGSGNDTLDGGSGNDCLTGGDGFDQFIITSGNDTITDFGVATGQNINDGDQTNNDFIDLSPYYDNLSEARADLDDDGVLNQSNDEDTKGRSVDYSDNTALSGSTRMSGTSSEAFTSDTTNLVCFATGTMIETKTGPLPVENLRCGMNVRTVDRGFQPVSWVGIRALTAADLVAQDGLHPIRIPAGALGLGLPVRDLRVSSQHRILVSGPIANRLFGSAEVLVPAKHLVSVNGIEVDQSPGGITYVHFMFERHEIVFSEGAPTEALYPGPQALKGLGADCRAELFSLFPELESPDEPAWTPARTFANGRLGRKLAERHIKNRKPLLQVLPGIAKSTGRAGFSGRGALTSGDCDHVY